MILLLLQYPATSGAKYSQPHPARFVWQNGDKRCVILQQFANRDLKEKVTGQ
ncbi:hypothetical protein yfred0001_41720 [Yersinia frederiksenii ATCC 33641]|nr:hypothetical protein yfred0001_41720 [Yersinia frederiksenii ATCC 33641]